jgi:hypothetical protein
MIISELSYMDDLDQANEIIGATNYHCPPPPKHDPCKPPPKHDPCKPKYEPPKCEPPKYDPCQPVHKGYGYTYSYSSKYYSIYISV